MGHLQCMDDTGYVTQDCQEDVDTEITTDPAFKENTDRRKEDGKDDFDDVAVKVENELVR